MTPSTVTTIDHFRALCGDDGPPWPGWPESCLENGLTLREAAERLDRLRDGFGHLAEAVHNWALIEMAAQPHLSYGAAMANVRADHLVSYLAAIDEMIIAHPAGLPADWTPEAPLNK